MIAQSKREVLTVSIGAERFDDYSFQSTLLWSTMKIDPRVRGRFQRDTWKRLSADLGVIGNLIGVAEYEAANDFRTEVLQSLGVGYYEPGTSLRLVSSEGGGLSKHPWFVIALVLEFHNRSQSRFRELSLAVSLSRFGSIYKVRGTVGWKWPLRVKYDTGYQIPFPFSASDTRVFDVHLSKLESIFMITARRSLRSVH